MNKEERQSFFNNLSLEPELCTTLLSLQGSETIKCILSNTTISHDYQNMALTNNPCPDALKMLLLLGANPTLKTAEHSSPLALNIQKIFDRKHHIILLCATPLEKIVDLKKEIVDKKIAISKNNQIWLKKFSI